MHVYIPMFMYSIYTITFARYEFCQNYHFTILIFIAKTSLSQYIVLLFCLIKRRLNLLQSWKILLHIFFHLHKNDYLGHWYTKYYLVQYSASNEFIAIFFSGRLYICTNTYQNVYLFPHFMPGPRTFKNTFTVHCCF